MVFKGRGFFNSPIQGFFDLRAINSHTLVEICQMMLSANTCKLFSLGFQSKRFLNYIQCTINIKRDRMIFVSSATFSNLSRHPLDDVHAKYISLSPWGFRIFLKDFTISVHTRTPHPPGMFLKFRPYRYNLNTICIRPQQIMFYTTY
jgi:hypothetical protein